MSGEPPWYRIEVTRGYEELGGPVEGELRREAIDDADVLCPRCGGREWVLIERRAEPEQPFTRWRALACAGCGAAGEWESAGRTRPGRAADGPNDCHEEIVAGLREAPTVNDLSRLASFRVFAPGPSAELRSHSHMAGKITGVTVAAGGVEVTSEVRQQVVYSLPFELPPEHRARVRLQDLVDDWAAVLRTPRSEPAQDLHLADASRRAAAHAAAARLSEAMIDVDGVSMQFALVEHDRCWAAVADIGDESITIAARDVPPASVALQALSAD